MYRSLSFISFALLGVLAATPASAAGVLEPAFWAPISLQQGQPQGPPPPSPEAIAQDLGITAGQPITVTYFQFNGNSGYGDHELRTVIKKWQGTPVTSADLIQALDALRNHYRAGGYPFIDVKLPQQQAAAGTVRIEVYEGEVAAINVVGNKRYTTAFLTHRIPDLAPGKVITNEAFQRSIILLNTLPGLQAQLAPAPVGPGKFALNLAVKEKPYKGTFSPDNSIRSQFGNVEMKFTMDFQNVSKHGDTFTVEPAALSQKWPSGIRLGYSRPLNNKGTSLSLLFIKADFQFISNSPLMGLQNDISYTVATVTHPLKMSFSENIFLNFGYVHATSAYVFGDTQFGETEKLDVGTASIVYMRTRPGKYQSNAFAQFTGNFRGNPDGTRNNAEPARLDIAGGHEQWFDEKNSIFVFGIGVLSKDPLLSSQKVTIGGPFCVRGFDVNEAQGDQGYLVKFELRHSMKVGKSNAPLQFKAMLDHGGVYRKIPDPYFPSPFLEDHLLAGGVGANIKLADKYFMSAEWSHPLNDHAIRDGRINGRWWLTATATF